MVQLILPLTPAPAMTRADFLVAPGNEKALAFLDTWPRWPAPAAVLWGPPASGKSHLAQIWAQIAGAPVMSAGALRDGVPDVGALVLEDIDPILGDAVAERALFALLERGTPLLATAQAAPSDWRLAMPDLHSRARALLAFGLGAPDEALLRALAAKLFADRQLAVPEAVVDRILLGLERSPGAVQGFIARLDARALSEKRPVNLGLVRDLLDGAPG